MDSAELIRRTARRSGEAAGIVETIMQAMLREISDAIDGGEPITIAEFGTFRMRYSSPANAPPYREPSFKATHAWRRRVNGACADG